MSESTNAPRAEPEFEGHELLTALSREMVRCMKEYFGKGALKAKTYLADDLCFIVLREALTTAEKTMLEKDGEESVRQFRLAYQEAMRDEIVSVVERLTGRRVLTYHSQVLFDPDVIIEMFVFDDVIAGKLSSA